jgi:hypothetical protein
MGLWPSYGATQLNVIEVVPLPLLNTGSGFAGTVAAITVKTGDLVDSLNAL